MNRRVRPLCLRRISHLRAGPSTPPTPTRSLANSGFCSIDGPPAFDPLASTASHRVRRIMARPVPSRDGVDRPREGCLGAKRLGAPARSHQFPAAVSDPSETVLGRRGNDEVYRDAALSGRVAYGEIANGDNRSRLVRESRFSRAVGRRGSVADSSPRYRLRRKTVATRAFSGLTLTLL